MKTVLTILSISIVGFLSFKSKSQLTDISSQTKVERPEITPTLTHNYYLQKPDKLQASVKASNEIGRQSAFDKNVSNRTYRPDNNPVTYDENPANYPLYKPKTYTNTYSTEVQSPTHYNAIPEGACAVCRDGSYSFSQNRRGTCSHHGGVARWLK